MTLPKTILYYWLTIIVFLSLPVFLCGQNLLPPVYNYNILEYQGGSKNWDLTVNSKGELFVANNKGMLYFDGERWTLNKLPNSTIIRSVLSVGERIYTGSYEEFGFWKKNAGVLEYTSLTHLIKGHLFTSEEFWEILSVDDTIFFRSFSSIYIYKNDTITVIEPSEVISDFIWYDDRMIVASSTSGLFELQDDALVPLENQEKLLNRTVTDIAVVDGKLIVGTKLNGCYFFENDELISWDEDLNEELKKHQLNKILKLDNGKIAFGTIKNGVYLYDFQTKESRVLNKASGLQNNTLLSMLQYEDQLWLGLDNGLGRVKLNSPIKYYTDNSGALGTVYDANFFEDKLYLGSNTGVFYFDDHDLRFINGTQGHVWDLETIDDNLLCGHNTGTFKIQKGNTEKISNISGGYEIIKIPEQSRTYIQGTYNGLATYKRQEDNSWEISKVEGIVFPIKQLCFESPTIVWAVHPYKGFYRVHLNEDYKSVLKIEQFDGIDIPTNYNIKVYKIKNQITLNIGGIWHKYDPILGEIVLFNEFQKFNGNDILNFDSSHFWFVANEEMKEIMYTDLKSDSLVITDLNLRKRLVPDSHNIIKINDSISFIVLSDGFAKINTKSLKKQLDSNKLPIPELNSLKGESIRIPIMDQYAFQLSFKNSRLLEVEFSTPKLIQPRYFYELQGPQNYSGYVEDGSISFQNLAYGEYEFKVSTVGVDNAISFPKTLTLTIDPPWYLSKFSLALYGLGIILSIFFIRWYNHRKLTRKQRELEGKMQKEQEETLAVLEKEKLAKEIKLKQNELASTTLNIAKKNEMLLELKDMLLVDKDKFANSQRYRTFIRKLNNSVKDTEDWKRFEISFKELHNDFFERLLSAYPKLTPKDLKLCAYLKMNLSTKEIAPLMAITVRGVEIHRYRLRKKLQIDGSENLSNFLITF